MASDQLITWLLKGDVSIQYQVYRDLLDQERPELQARISTEGWGAIFLSNRLPNKHWGGSFYQPKWISSHYTILDLKNLGISPNTPAIQETIQLILREEKSTDGGVNPSSGTIHSDVCVNGMFLNYASYFQAPTEDLHSIVDFLLSQRVKDGGFNCHSNRQGCVHSSLHTTISVLEGILEYEKNGYIYRLTDLQSAATAAREFILMHRLYKSDKTGAVIDPKMTMLSYPTRWWYDILRAMDYFQNAKIAWDPRMQDAMALLLNKQAKDGTWPLQNKHSGRLHLDMEPAGKQSRWNTLRALRVLKQYPFEL